MEHPEIVHRALGVPLKQSFRRSLLSTVWRVLRDKIIRYKVLGDQGLRNVTL